MRRTKFGWLTGLVLLCLAGTAHAQLVAENDSYGVPFGEDLVVEAPGVLDNDTFNGEAAEEGGAVVDLPVISDVAHGTLVLNSDGSFSYTPGQSFSGTDSFTYQVSVGDQTDQATVVLSACDTGPTVFFCWQEAPYLEKLGELGYGTFQEGFEDDLAWGGVRYPNTASSVLSNGITWRSNHPDPPASNEISTSGGSAVTGLWGIIDPEHGYATGTPAECDIDNPPTTCLYKDGLTGTREAGESTLYGVGGYFTGTAIPNMVVMLDGGMPITLGRVYVGPGQFFGVIDTGGFSSFRFEETDGKIGQMRLVFADDFTIGVGTMIFSCNFETGTTADWSATVP